MLIAVGLPMMMGMLWTTGLASAHGGDSSQVHACVVPESGNIRIVEPGQSCHKNEMALDWTRSAGATYSAGSGLTLSADNQFSVTDVPWSTLTAVPPGFADGTDNDGSVHVAQLRADLSSGNAVVDGSVIRNDTITASKIASGAIESSEIKDGTITSVDLAGSDSDTDYNVPGDQTITGAVTSEKIADGQVQARDLSATLLQRIVDLENEVAALKAAG